MKYFLWFAHSRTNRSDLILKQRTFINNNELKIAIYNTYLSTVNPVSISTLDVQNYCTNLFCHQLARNCCFSKLAFRQKDYQLLLGGVIEENTHRAMHEKKFKSACSLENELCQRKLLLRTSATICPRKRQVKDEHSLYRKLQSWWPCPQSERQLMAGTELQRPSEMGPGPEGVSCAAGGRRTGGMCSRGLSVKWRESVNQSVRGRNRQRGLERERETSQARLSVEVWIAKDRRKAGYEISPNRRLFHALLFIDRGPWSPESGRDTSSERAEGWLQLGRASHACKPLISTHLS